jgi:hypothetical protein
LVRAALRAEGDGAAGRTKMNKIIQNDEHTMSPDLSAFFRAARLRFRAEECRVIGEDMTNAHTRSLMQRLAADYDQLADSLENKHVVH